MGEGIFGIDRPGTAGDSGWFGAPRPLVGAANGIKAEVSTQSATMVAVSKGTPQSITNVREELNEVNRLLDNKRSKLERVNDFAGMTEFLEEGLTGVAAERRRDELVDDVERLEVEREELMWRLNRVNNRAEEGDVPPDEVEDEIQMPVEDALLGMGISKGPFVTVKPETTEILFTKSNIREDDIEMTRNALDDAGFQVIRVQGVEIDKLFD